MRLPSRVLRNLLLLLSFASLALQVQVLKAQLSETSHKPEIKFDPQPWLDDLHELIAAMDSHYADLEWAIKDRHMDLPRLRQDTEQKLRDSPDNQAAQRIFEQFLDTFGDGHLSIKWPTGEVSELEPPEPLCRRLGYRNPNKRGIAFSALPSFVDLPGEGSDLFPGGLLNLPQSKVGTIRISSFNEHGFPDACESVLRELHLDAGSACDHRCQNMIALQISNYLTAEIVKRARQLRSQGASALLIDLTHNDGGDDWNEAVARSLSPILLVDESRGFLKVPSWTTKLQNDLRAVEEDVERGAQPTGILTKAAARLRLAVAESEESCDRSRAFEDGSLNCSLIVKDGLFWSGALPYAKPGSLASLRSKTVLFNPLQFKYAESSNRLPLFVAVDAHSWSSAERFAALLQDNRAATIVGELTGGAGCGSVNGGIPTTLTHSHARVEMPNCVGIRKDGSNANDGVTPDILVPWAERDTPYVKAEKLVLVLKKANHRGAASRASTH
jgi:hypothetical protein